MRTKSKIIMGIILSVLFIILLVIGLIIYNESRHKNNAEQSDEPTNSGTIQEVEKDDDLESSTGETNIIGKPNTEKPTLNENDATEEQQGTVSEESKTETDSSNVEESEEAKKDPESLNGEEPENEASSDEEKQPEEPKQEESEPPQMPDKGINGTDWV